MSFLLFEIFLLLIIGVVAKDVNFDENYVVTWGNHHVTYFSQGKDIQLSMDQSSGSGFASKLSYRSGFFHMRIKLTEKDSAGVVTAFYLTSDGGNHDELDFEFLGNREGKPITLQTNIFTNGEGNREQRILLWFDPTADYHTYKILWNEHHVVFYVDNIPIRVFKNNTNIGVGYPSQAMRIEASLWDGSDWATDGGRTKINWSHAPFQAHFQGFDIAGCPSTVNLSRKISAVDQIKNLSTFGFYDQDDCDSLKWWWNAHKFWKLDKKQQKAYEYVRENYMNYDYCSDNSRHPAPQECLSNS